MFRKYIVLFLLYALSVFAMSANADVVVVVSAKSPIKSLTSKQTARIFLGKVATFPDGRIALPFDQPEGSKVRDEFYTKVAHKNSAQLSAYWAKIIFTGDGRPPDMLPDDAAVRRGIARNPNAIGYIDRRAVNRTVRVVLKP